MYPGKVRCVVSCHVRHCSAASFFTCTVDVVGIGKSVHDFIRWAFGKTDL